MQTVFVNGCFDILHRGHIELFKFANSLGDKLIVALDTDDRIKISKGESRPHNRLEDRREMLLAIRWIDKVLSFSTDSELENLIKNIKPDRMIVGSDWQGKNVIGAQHAKNLIFFERIGEYSTTKTIQHIGNR